MIIRHITLVGCYATICALPLCLLLAGKWSNNAELEFRKPIDHPALPWNDSSLRKSVGSDPGLMAESFHLYTKRWDDFFTKEFVFKKQLLRPYQMIRTSIFGVDPSPSIYIKGSNGWYFSGDWHTQTLSRGIGMDTLSSFQIEAIVNRHLQHKRFLDSMHIPYLVLVVPDKHPVYREFLPMKYAQHQGLREQVLGALKKKGIEVLDATDTLRHARLREPVYYKTDGHWTDAGAYQAYLMLMDRFKSYHLTGEPLQRKDFQISKEHKVFSHFYRSTGDSSGEWMVKWKLRNPRAILKSRSEHKWPGEILSTVNQFEHPDRSATLLLFGDSFSSPLVRMLKENFGRTIHCLQCSVDTGMIKKNKPDIVLFEVVQSNLESR
jgi:alginate O-acetyltransferase complex protein AlgJ